MSATKGVIHFNDFPNSYIPNILKEIYLDRVYAPFMRDITDKVVLDLGMNIGLWSLFAGQYAKQVHGFEPAKQTYDLALQNITDNHLTNKVIPHHAAIADTDGEMTLYHNTNSTMNSLNVMVNDNSQESEKVPTYRLDTFLAANKIDHVGFAKIDVEGTEHILFASDSFKAISPMLDAFVYEWHQWCGVNPHIINAGLKELGYVIQQIPSEAVIFGAKKQ